MPTPPSILNSPAAAPTSSLRQPGAILLVSCYELGHQPLGIAWLGGFLGRAGFDPTALDLSVEPFDDERVRRAHLIAISVPMHTALRLGLKAAARVRAVNPRAHICFHGLYAALHAAWLMEQGIDSAVGGESEELLVSLANALDAGRSSELPGITTRRRTYGPELVRVDFPAPARDLLPPLTKYARIERNGQHGLAAAVEASRGCRHQCRHCPIPPAYDGRFFAVPREVVLSDIRHLVAAGAHHITFADPDFLNAPTHSLRIVRAMHAEFPGLTFDFTAKVEHVLEHRTLFAELAALGALFMVTAVESLSDTVLAHLEKGHTRADVFEALDILRHAGIALRPSLLAFTPWTTLEDYLELLETVADQDLVDHVDPVQFSIRLLIPPGSLLLRHEAIRPYLGSFDSDAFGYRWTHPDPRMDRLHAAVGALVAEASQANEDPRRTFQRVRDLAWSVVGQRRPASPGASDADARRHRAPRLTEPWFC